MTTRHAARNPSLTRRHGAEWVGYSPNRNHPRADAASMAIDAVERSETDPEHAPPNEPH
jgi:hypothetical protein